MQGSREHQTTSTKQHPQHRSGGGRGRGCLKKYLLYFYLRGIRPSPQVSGILVEPGSVPGHEVDLQISTFHGNNRARGTDGEG